VIETEFFENHTEVHDQDEEAEIEYKIKQLYQAIHQLNQVEKAVLFLFLEKCSYKEIGDITGLTEKYVSVILYRSKEKMRSILANQNIK